MPLTLSGRQRLLPATRYGAMQIPICKHDFPASHDYSHVALQCNRLSWAIHHTEQHTSTLVTQPTFNSRDDTWLRLRMLTMLCLLKHRKLRLDTLHKCRIQRQVADHRRFCPQQRKTAACAIPSPRHERPLLPYPRRNPAQDQPTRSTSQPLKHNEPRMERHTSRIPPSTLPQLCLSNR